MEMVELEIMEVGTEELPVHLDELSRLLLDCVNAGASIGFLTPFSMEQACRFWQTIGEALAGGGRRLFVIGKGKSVLGTVQLILDMPGNGQHRAEIAKLMVHPTARRAGIGRQLMQHAENLARSEGRQLIVLDTRSGDHAEALYTSLGYQLAGKIPAYARSTTGQMADTSFMYKTLEERLGI